MEELRQVRVRGAGGKIALCRVVTENADYVYVVSEREYQRAIREGLEVEARLGFPREDVVINDERPAV